MKGTVLADSSLFIVRAVVGICSGCTIFSYSNCIAAFRASGPRHRGARPSQGPSTDRPCRSRSRPGEAKDYGIAAGESVWGVESAQPFLAGGSACCVVAAIGDQPHRFAHQLAASPGGGIREPSPRRRYRSCGPAGFRTAAGGASPPCGLRIRP